MATLKRLTFLFVALAGTAPAVQAAPVQTLCRGNIETFDRKILHAGVDYWLWYDITGSNAVVNFAGREYKATADTGKTWSGPWLQHIKAGPYLSYLPSAGGTIRAELETGVWFSGNCLPERA